MKNKKPFPYTQIFVGAVMGIVVNILFAILILLWKLITNL